MSSPGRSRDRLFDATYLHTHHDTTGLCNNCIKDIGICAKECDELGYQDTRLIKEVRAASNRDSNSDCHLRLHFGRYGIANTVLKSGIDRDELVMKHKTIVFETEGAGVWERMPTIIIIKSACEYADSHKRKGWQNYAAATSATGFKAILEQLETDDGLLGHTNNYGILFDLDSIQIAKISVGPPEEMRKLEEALLPDKRNNGRRIFVLRGLGDIGKTQLTVKFMRMQQAQFTALF